MKPFLKILPWLFVALFATEMVVVLLPKTDGEFHTAAFGRLPVLLNGRIQPLDSVGRNALLQIRSTGDLPLELVPTWKFWHHPEKLRSSEWLAEVLFRPEQADTRPIFLVHHPELISDLKLDGQGIERSGLRYYTFNELRQQQDAIASRGEQAAKLEAAQRTTYQKQALKLAHAMSLYRRLKNSIQPEQTHDFARLVAVYREILPAGRIAARARQTGQPADETVLRRLATVAQQFARSGEMAYPLVVPPNDPATTRDWQSIGNNLIAAIGHDEIHPAVDYYARMATAYHDSDAAAFNGAVAEYRAWLEPVFPAAIEKGEAEYYFNRVKAFLHATIIYLAAFVLAGGALLTYGAMPQLSESLRRSAFYLVGLAFVVHSSGLVYRMILEGRPPVTNLYSSAVFIGWGACVLGMILERVYRVGLGSAVAGLAGFVTLLIAHNLALGGDTMEMLRAVLDTNFWLATHVVVITLGYSANFVAGGLAMAYIALGLCTPLLGKELGGERSARLGTALARMVYGIICFATLFSFVGTVLGGIWADQSWGRFWGWDPKENGALMIVIWNALILHARWGGLVRDRGLMNLAIFGNIVTAFSWFGVNMLGIGLHSYGFMDAAFRWLMLFNALNLAVMLASAVPLSRWRSFRTA